MPFSIYNWDYKKFISEYNALTKELGLDKKETTKSAVSALGKDGEWDPAKFMVNLCGKYDSMYPAPDIVKKYQPVAELINKSWSPEQAVNKYTDLLERFRDAASRGDKGEMRYLKMMYGWNASRFKEHPLEQVGDGILKTLFYRLPRKIYRTFRDLFTSNTEFLDKIGREKSFAEKRAERYKKKLEEKENWKLVYYNGTPIGLYDENKKAFKPLSIAPAAPAAPMPYAPPVPAIMAP